jgi:hypothetical protein
MMATDPPAPDPGAPFCRWCEHTTDDCGFPGSDLPPCCIPCGYPLEDCALRTDIEILKAERGAQAARLAHTGTYCAFCTAEFPDEDPDTVAQIQRHVYECPLHPMRQAERDRDEMDSKATRYRVALEAQAARLAAVSDALMYAISIICNVEHPTVTPDVPWEPLRRRFLDQAHAALGPPAAERAPRTEAPGAPAGEEP